MTIYIEMDTVNRTTGASSTYYLQEYDRVPRQLFTAWTWEHFPIVKGFNLNSSLKKNVIDRVSGTVTLDIENHSLGYEQRFLNILENEEIINQRIEIVNIFRGKVKTYSADFERNELKIDCELELYDDDILNHNLRRTDWADLQGTAGKIPCPLVFGADQFVKPVIVGKDFSGTLHSTTTNYSSHAYSTILHSSSGQKFNSGGVQENYVKDHDGKYKPFIGATHFATVYHGEDISTTYGNWNVHKYMAIPISRTEGVDNIIAFGGFFVVGDMDTYSAGETGHFIFQICTNAGGLPDKVLAEGKRDLSDFTWVGTGVPATNSWNRIKIPFQKIVPITEENLFIVLGIEFDDNGSGAIPPRFVEKTSGSTYSTKYVKTLSSSDLWRVPAGTLYHHYLGLYGIDVSDDADGNDANKDDEQSHFSFIEVHAPTKLDGVDTNQDTSLLDYYFKIDGLKDNADGDITGTGSLLLEQPDHVASLVLSTRDASGYWIPRDLNTTRFATSNAILSNSSHEFYRKIGGSVHNFTTRSSLISDIARESGTFFYLDANYTTTQKPVIYTWGEEVTASATFTDLDSRIEDLFSVDQSGVVNTCEFTYSRNFSDIQVESFLFDLENYEQFENAIVDGHGLTSDAISATSFTLYGERKNSREQINYLSDQTSIETFQQYILRTHDRPAIYIRVTKPEINPSVNILETVNLIFPQLPAYYGSNAKTFNKEDGTTQTYAPYSSLRAQRYKGQVYGVRNRFNSGTVFETEYLIRLLIHENDPTL